MYMACHFGKAVYGVGTNMNHDQSPIFLGILSSFAQKMPQISALPLTYLTVLEVEQQTPIQSFDRNHTAPNPLPQRRIQRTIIEISALEIIPPIRRERHCRTTRPLNRKRRDENEQFRATTNGRGEDIVVPDEPLRVPLADEELHEEADGEVQPDRGVDAD